MPNVEEPVDVAAAAFEMLIVSTPAVGTTERIYGNDAAALLSLTMLATHWLAAVTKLLLRTSAPVATPATVTPVKVATPLLALMVSGVAPEPTPETPGTAWLRQGRSWLASAQPGPENRGAAGT